MNKKILAIILLVVLLLVAFLIFLNKDTKTNTDSNTSANPEITKEAVDNSIDTFVCYVDGERNEYANNISIDSPIPTETRVSGISEDGSNIKLILRTQTTGTYTLGKDFGMSYQNYSSGFDYNQIYSPISSSTISLNLQEFSETRITAEFSGDIYDGSNNKIFLSDCFVNVAR